MVSFDNAALLMVNTAVAAAAASLLPAWQTPAVMLQAMLTKVQGTRCHCQAAGELC